MACACKLGVGLWRCVFIRKLWVFLMVPNLKKENMVLKGLSGIIDMNEGMLSLMSSMMRHSCLRISGLM